MKYGLHNFATVKKAHDANKVHNVLPKSKPNIPEINLSTTLKYTKGQIVWKCKLSINHTEEYNSVTQI